MHIFLGESLPAALVLAEHSMAARHGTPELQRESGDPRNVCTVSRTNWRVNRIVVLLQDSSLEKFRNMVG